MGAYACTISQGCRTARGGRSDARISWSRSFDRCIMSVAVLGPPLTSWSGDFRPSNRFLRGRAGGEATIRHMFVTWASFSAKKNTMDAQRRAKRLRQWEAPAALPKTHDGETADRFRSQLPLIRADFIHPFFASVARDRRHGPYCLYVVWPCVKIRARLLSELSSGVIRVVPKSKTRICVFLKKKKTKISISIFRPTAIKHCSLR